MNSRTVRLLDYPRAVNQIASLERRTARGARDSIDHLRDAHDDAANAIAGLVYVTAQRPVGTIYFGSYEDPYAGWRREQERKKRRFLSLREEAESGVWNAPCTVPLPEPSAETVRRWGAAAAASGAAVAAER